MVSSTDGREEDGFPNSLGSAEVEGVALKDRVLVVMMVVMKNRPNLHGGLPRVSLKFHNKKENTI